MNSSPLKIAGNSLLLERISINIYWKTSACEFLKPFQWDMKCAKESQFYHLNNMLLDTLSRLYHKEKKLKVRNVGNKDKIAFYNDITLPQVSTCSWLSMFEKEENNVSIKSQDCSYP